jgi:hypothetical protein
MVRDLDTEAIRSRTASDLASHLIAPAATRHAVFAGLSLLLCWVPILGLILGLLAVRRTRRSHGFAKLVSIAATFVAALITVPAVIAVIAALVGGGH